MSNADYEMKVEMTDEDGTQAVARYESVSLGSSPEYRLSVGNYKNNTGVAEAGDSLSGTDEAEFETKPQACAVDKNSPGW